MTNSERHIYHFTEPETYERSKSSGYYRPRAFDKEGFIHCSTREQVLHVANFIAPKDRDLVLLEIDTDRVSAEIRYENLEGGEKLFPHIYGELETSAILRAEPFCVNSAGAFEFPAGYQGSR